MKFSNISKRNSAKPKSSRRPGRPQRAVAILALVASTSTAYAAPQGAQVIAGSATISHTNSLTSIVAGNNSIISYSSFDIASSETVKFIQPSSSSRVLNLIQSATPTQINGSLQANGIVYLVNPAGVMFGQGSTVNVGALYAAAGSMSNADFLAGTNHFTQLTGTVSAAGTIQANQVSLVALYVANSGSIVTPPGGFVTLAAGTDVYLQPAAGGILVNATGVASGSAAATSSTPATSNSGTIQAPVGQVYLGAGDMYSIAISTTGSVKAANVTVSGGTNSQTNVSGSIDASNTTAGATGGTIEVLGGAITLTNATLNASGDAGGGSIFIGGSMHGKGPLPNANSVSIQEGVTLDADAINTGNGGTIVAWSNQYTYFDGSATALGGAQSGNGGTIETSSAYIVTVNDESGISAAAPHGNKGSWLLDPGTPLIIAAEGSDDGTLEGDNSPDDNQSIPADSHSVTDPVTGQQLHFSEEADPGETGSDSPYGSNSSPLPGANASFVHTVTVDSAMVTTNVAMLSEGNNAAILQYSAVNYTGATQVSLTYSAGSAGVVGQIMILSGESTDPDRGHWVPSQSAYMPGAVDTGAITSTNATMNVTLAADQIAVLGQIMTNGGSFSATPQSNSTGQGGFSLGGSSAVDTPIAGNAPATINTAGGNLMITPPGAVNIDPSAVLALGTGGTMGSAMIHSANSTVNIGPALTAAAADVTAMGNMTVNGVSTTGAQTYAGGSLTVSNSSLTGNAISIAAPMTSLTASGAQTISAGSGTLSTTGAIVKTGGDLSLQGTMVMLNGVNSSGTQTVTGSQIIVQSGNLTGTGVTLAAPTTALTGSAAQMIEAGSGVLSAGGAINKSNGGDLTLQGTQGLALTGQVTNTSGAVNLQDAASSAGALTVQGTTVTVNGVSTTGAQTLAASQINVPSGNLTGSSVSLSGPANFSSATSQTLNAGSGALIASGAITQTGGGDLMFMSPTQISTTGVTSNSNQTYMVTAFNPTSDVLGAVQFNGVYNSGGKNIIINEGVFFGNPTTGPNGPNADENHVPSVSTIYFLGGSLTFQTDGGQFIMGQNQKIAVSGGNLTINTMQNPDANPETSTGADGNAYLGDLVAVGPPGLGNILVETGTGTISLIKRSAEPETELVDGVPTLVPDTFGLHFIASGSIKFLSQEAIALVGNSPAPSFFVGSQYDAESEVPSGDTATPAFGIPTSLAVVTGSVSGAPGVTITSLQDLSPESLNSQPDTPVQQASVVLATDITENEAATIGLGGSGLVAMGVPAREETDEEQLEEDLTGYSIYDDSPRTLQAKDSDLRIASPRVLSEAAATGEALARELFTTTIINPQTGAETRVNRTADVRKTLIQAYSAYQSAGEPGGFISYLQQTPNYSQALGYAELVQKLNSTVDRLGLTDYETQVVRHRLFEPITPKGVSTDQFLASL